MSFLPKTQRLLVIALLGFFLVWGIMQTFLLPRFEVPDENAHWIVAHNRMATTLGIPKLSCENLLNFNAPNEMQMIVPPRMLFSLRVFSKEPMPSDFQKICDHYDTGYGGVSTYYGVVIANAFLRPFIADSGVLSLWIFYFSRLINGLTILLLTFRLLILSKQDDTNGWPTGAMLVLVFFFSPLFVQQAFGVSSDVVVVACCLVLATWLMAWDRVNILDILTLGFFGYAAVITKPVIFPFFLPVLCVSAMLKMRAEKNRLCLLTSRNLVRNETNDEGFFPKRRFSGLGSVHLISILIGVIFTGIAFYVVMGSVGGSPSSFGAAAPISGQKAYLLSHPLEAGAVVIWSTVKWLVAVREYAGPLAWYDFYPMDLWLGIFLIVFWKEMRTFFSEIRSLTIRPLLIWLFAVGGLMVIFVAALGNVLAMYLSWSPVGSMVVIGLQGRYFFPMWIVFAAMLSIPMSWVRLAGNTNEQGSSDIDGRTNRIAATNLEGRGFSSKFRYWLVPLGLLALVIVQTILLVMEFQGHWN